MGAFFVSFWKVKSRKSKALECYFINNKVDIKFEKLRLDGIQRKERGTKQEMSLKSSDSMAYKETRWGSEPDLLEITAKDKIKS